LFRLQVIKFAVIIDLQNILFKLLSLEAMELSSSLLSSGNLPDFSPLVKIAQNIQEVMLPFAEIAASFQAFLQPILNVLAELQPKIDGIIEGLKEASRSLIVIEKLGDAQFVQWNYLSEEFIDAVLSSNNTNKTLRHLLLTDKFKSVDVTIEKCMANSYLHKYMRLFEQSVIAFKSGQSDLAVIGFTSIIDGLLSDISGIETTNIAKRSSAILSKLEENEFVDSDEYALLALMLTFQKTISSFSASSDFSKKEPKGLNRHWIMHGRSHRKKTKLDCVKLINLIYGIILIDEFGKKEPDSTMSL